MTMSERVASYNRAFAKWPASRLSIGKEQDREVAYGIWLIGQDYQNKSKYYGAYPARYLERLSALFPRPYNVLHVFSGSLPPGEDYIRCDAVQPAEYTCDVLDLPQHWEGDEADLIYADPPYSVADAKLYNYPMVNRGRVMRALAAVTRTGGHCVWLDTVWPMHSKTQWVTVGRIPIIRSTNHRIRLCSIFERV